MSDTVGSSKNSFEVNEPTAHERGKWGSKAEFVLSALGYAVGLGNVWRFPWMTWKNGGGAFLIPYLIMMNFAGLPLFFMEVTLGQYSGVGPNKLFDCAPLFKGLGYGMIAISFFTGLYYNVVIMWSFYYMFAGFTSKLPWVGCHNAWNTENCYDNDEAKACEKSANISAVYIYRQCCKNDTVTGCSYNYTDAIEMKQNLSSADRVAAAQEFFNYRMYALNYLTENGTNNGTMRPMEDIGMPKWDITLTLLLSWIVIYVCLFQGIKTSGKVVYFTALFPYVVLLILLIFGLTLDGSGEGVKFYLYPNFTKLQSAEIWADAASQVFFSLSVGQGGLMTYSSYNEFNNNILRDTLIVTIGDAATSIVAGIPIFAILGFMSVQLNKTVNEVVTSGSGLAFVAYPEVVTKMPVPPLWAFLFFFMLITLGLDSQFAGIEVMMTGITDHKPKWMKWKPLISALLCGGMFLITINLVCDAGIFWEELINYYSGWSLVLIALVEVLVYAWIYGADNILKNLEEMLGWKFNKFGYWYFWFIWKLLSPAMLLAIVVYNFIDTSKLAYMGYELPNWAQALGWLIAVIPLLLIVLFAVIEIVRDYKKRPSSKKTFLQRCRHLLKPNKNWKKSIERYGETNKDGIQNESYIQSSTKI